MRADLERVAEAFDRARIEWIVLKGLPLAARIYGSIATRFSVDNDVLVRLADVPRAFSALTEIGYKSSPGRILEEDLASTFQHPMRRTLPSGLLARFELHWNAFPPHLYAVPESLLWSRVERCSLGPMELRVFDPELTLLHLASHFVQHRCSESRILEDVARALTTWESRLDRPTLAALARETGTAPAFAFVSRAAWQLGLTGVRPWASDSRAELVSRFLSAERLRFSESPSYWRMAISLLLAAPGRLPHALKYELFPHRSVLARIYQTPIPERAHALQLRRLLRPFSRGRFGGRPR